MKTKYTSVILALFISTYSFTQDEQWFRVESIPSDLALRNINIMPDGEVWLGTFWAGAKQLSNNVWIDYNTSNSGLSDDDVREISKDSDGNYWFATWSNLSKYNPTDNVWEIFNVSGVTNDILQSVEVDDEDRIWVGTDGGDGDEDGLYLLNTGEFFNSDNSPLGSNWVPFLETDNEGNIWAGGRNLVKIEGTTMTGTSIQSLGFSIYAQVASAIDFNSSNHIWLAVYDGGLAYFNGFDWTIYTAENSGLPQNKLWSLVVDKNDNVWIGTENYGLVKFDGTNWTIFNTSNSPITNNRINALNCDSLNNIWVAPSYGGLLLYNQNGVASVAGNVFYDLNSDNIRQVNEPPTKNALIALSPGEYYGVTDSNGNYKIHLLQEGEYSISAYPQREYVMDVFPQQSSLDVNPNFEPATQDFAIHITPDVSDISVVITAMNAAVNGFNTTYSITVTNSGTVAAEDIVLQFFPDDILPFVSASGNPIVNDDFLQWNISNLEFEESITFEVVLGVPAGIEFLGAIVQNSVSGSIEGDVNLENNEDSVSQVVLGSYDPNDKLVFPIGEGSEGNVPLETEKFNYTIRFQNTGTYAAWRVIVTDQISPLLDLRTLKTIASSHEYTVEISNDRTVSWIFNNIDLPFEDEDEQGSNGFVRFTISPNEDVDYGNVIQNQANIYFDYNPPIITNQTTNTFFDFGLSVDKVHRNRLVLVYPNPASTQFSISSALNSFPMTVMLYDHLGRVLQKEVLTETRSIKIQPLSKGLIFYKILSGDGESIGSGKLLLQ